MPPVVKSQLLSKLALAKVSEDLTGSPALRAAFVKNPSKFIKDQYGHAPVGDEKQYFENLKKMVADGWCCGGCACSGIDLNTKVIGRKVIR